MVYITCVGKTTRMPLTSSYGIASEYKFRLNKLVERRKKHSRKELSCSKFSGRLVSRNNRLDLKPLDFFLLGHVKGNVYADNSQEESTSNKEYLMSKNSRYNFAKRMVVCQRSRKSSILYWIIY